MHGIRIREDTEGRFYVEIGNAMIGVFLNVESAVACVYHMYGFVDFGGTIRDSMDC